MTITSTACTCGAPVFVKKSGECRACYHRRWRNDRRQPTIPALDPCSYLAAHKRVHRTRGKATTHSCPCGAPAEQWSFDGCDHPIIGTTPKYTNGVRQDYAAIWSGDPDNYTARCNECHYAMDAQLRRARQTPQRVGTGQGAS